MLYKRVFKLVWVQVCTALHTTVNKGLALLSAAAADVQQHGSSHLPAHTHDTIGVAPAQPQM